VTATSTVEAEDVERCRAILGAEAIGLSDLQVLDALRHAEALARLLVEIHQARGGQN
jgi:hypothetical protein